MTTQSTLFQTALYSAHSIPDVLMEYEQLLKQTGDIQDHAHYFKVLEYRKMITNKKLLSKMRRNFNGLYSLIDEEYPDLRFLITGRRKSVISTENKFQKLLFENKSLDLIRDIFGFMILLFGKNSPELIHTCYSVAQRVIEYNLEKGLTLCEADIVSQTESFSKEDHPTIILPDKSGISEKFQYGVKDYILNPKKNGYQSIHMIFRTTSGECFEVQVRTLDMHIHAESGDANHLTYKQTKYKRTINFDSSRVDIPGYGISESGDIFDFIGLENSLEILKRQKTY